MKIRRLLTTIAMFFALSLGSCDLFSEGGEAYDYERDQDTTSTKYDITIDKSDYVKPKETDEDYASENQLGKATYAANKIGEVTVGDIQLIEFASSESEDEDSKISINFLGGSLENFVVKLVQTAESTVYSLLTQTNTGKTITKAYYILEDGTKKAIEDFTNFAIYYGIIGLSVDVGDSVPVTWFSLRTHEFSYKYFDTPIHFDLKYDITPENASNKRVKYYSTNPAVASVNHNGKVTVHRVGEATITALTLDGAFYDTCSVSIQDGESMLRDSFENASFLEGSLVGNRYDEQSTQENEYTCVERSSFTSNIVIAGNIKYNDNSKGGVINYGFGVETGAASFIGNTEIDGANAYSSDTVEDLKYNAFDNRFIVLSQRIVNSSTKSALIYYNEQYSEYSHSYRLHNIGELELLGSSGEQIFLNHVETYGRKIIAVGYATKPNKQGVESKYGCYFIVDGSNNRYTKYTDSNVIEYTGVYIDEEKQTGIITSTTTNNATMIKTVPGLGTSCVGYIKLFDSPVLRGVSFLSDSCFVISMEGLSGNKTIGAICVFEKSASTSKYEMVKYKRIELTSYLDFKVVGAELVTGKIKIICNGSEEYGGFLGIGKETRHFLLDIDMSLDLKFISGTKHFNNSSSGGKKQFANDFIAINDEIIAVGYANYANADRYNGYVQIGL